MMKAVTMVVSVGAAAISLAGVVIDAPGNVYTDQEKCSASGGCAGERWTLADWRGRVLKTGTFDTSGRMNCDKLPVGYYHVKCSREDATFAVVPIPERRVFDHASFYGVDSAQSWVSSPGNFQCRWWGGDTYRLVSDLIWRAGFPHVRERMAPAEVSPRPGSYDYAKYMYNADLLKARNIKISGLFHSVPKYMDPIQRLPRDLAALYAFSRDTARAFGERMGDWEFWNEQDISFAPEPVWDYVAAQKAAYLGLKAGNPRALAMQGALCGRRRSFYDATMYSNDLAKYSDVFNFHMYAPLSKYPSIFSELHDFMARQGVGDREVWITENSMDGEGDAAGDSVKPGKKAHSPEQELVLAEFYPKSQIALQMQGVSRNYFFVFGAYNERGGKKDWGVMRRDGTVKPIYAAMSAMTRELVSARLEGELKLGEGFKGYLFAQPDGTQTLAFWSVSPVDTSVGSVLAKSDYAATLKLPIPPGRYSLTDLCGQRSALTTNVVTATRYPAYVSGLRGLKAEVAPFARGNSAPYVPAADEDLSVIIRADLNTNDVEIAGHKSIAVLRANTCRLRLQIWNLSPRAKRGSLAVAGGRLDGVPTEIALPPMGKSQFDCTYTARTSNSYMEDFVVSGIFNGKRTSRLTIPVRNEAVLLATCRRHDLRKDWQNPKAWRKNTSATSYAATWDEREQAVRFDLAWTNDVDRWCYPIYKLNLPEDGFEGALMFEFAIKSEQDKVENDFRNLNVMLIPADEKKKASNRFLGYSAPLNTWETRRVDIGSVANCDEKVGSISIGLNPRGKKCTYWIKNLRLLQKGH